jgi:glycosyltransferase involved in cell wall biosynthesis
VVSDLVSIIIPIYNAENYLNRCIKSVLNQTYKKIEVILVNDGSTDKSVDICNHFCSKDERIKVIHNQNKGVSATRNDGLKAANGEFIQFVDADDYVDINYTKHMLRNMKLNCDIVISGYNIEKMKDGNITIKKNTPSLKRDLSKKLFKENFGLLFSESLINPVWNKIYKNEIIQKQRVLFSEEINMGEDLLFNLKYFEHCQKINILSDHLYNYIDFGSDTLTRSYKKNYYQVQKLLYSSMRSFLEADDLYTNHNLRVLENFYVDNIINCIDNLFHKNSHLKKKDITNEIILIVKDTHLGFYQIDQYPGSTRNRLVIRLAKSKKIKLLYSYFILKNYLNDLRARMLG